MAQRLVSRALNQGGTETMSKDINWAVLGTGVIANEMAAGLQKMGKSLYAVGRHPDKLFLKEFQKEKQTCVKNRKKERFLSNICHLFLFFAYLIVEGK